MDGSGGGQVQACRPHLTLSHLPYPCRTRNHARAPTLKATLPHCFTLSHQYRILRSCTCSNAHASSLVSRPHSQTVPHFLTGAGSCGRARASYPGRSARTSPGSYPHPKADPSASGGCCTDHLCWCEKYEHVWTVWAGLGCREEDSSLPRGGGGGGEGVVHVYSVWRAACVECLHCGFQFFPPRPLGSNASRTAFLFLLHSPPFLCSLLLDSTHNPPGVPCPFLPLPPPALSPPSASAPSAQCSVTMHSLLHIL